MRLAAIFYIFVYGVNIAHANDCRHLMGHWGPDTLTYEIPESLVLKITDPHPTDRQVLSWAGRALSYVNALDLQGSSVADRMRVGPVLLHRLSSFDRPTQKLLKDLQRQSAHSFHKYGLETGKWVVTVVGGEKRLSPTIKSNDPTKMMGTIEVLNDLIADLPKPLIDQVRFYHTHPTNELWRGFLSAHDQKAMFELAQQFAQMKLGEGSAYPEFHVYALPTSPRGETLVSHFSLQLQPRDRIRYTVID